MVPGVSALSDIESLHPRRPWLRATLALVVLASLLLGLPQRQTHILPVAVMATASGVASVTTADFSPDTSILPDTGIDRHLRAAIDATRLPARPQGTDTTPPPGSSLAALATRDAVVLPEGAPPSPAASSTPTGKRLAVFGSLRKTGPPAPLA